MDFIVTFSYMFVVYFVFCFCFVEFRLVLVCLVWFSRTEFFCVALAALELTK